MVRSTRLVPAAMLLALAPAVQAQLFSFSGQSNFIQDLDSADGVNLNTALPGSYSGEFEIDTDGIVLVSNSQSQGGSRTTYSGVILNNLTLQTNVGELVIADSPIIGALQLWDRANFGSGQHLVSLVFDLDDFSFVSIDFVANFGTGAFGNLFNVGTPNPNTFLSILPFGNPGDPTGLYSSAGITLDANSPFLPGRGRYFGTTNVLTVVPAPGSMGVLALAGLAAARRRR